MPPMMQGTPPTRFFDLHPHRRQHDGYRLWSDGMMTLASLVSPLLLHVLLSVKFHNIVHSWSKGTVLTSQQTCHTCASPLLLHVLSVPMVWDAQGYLGSPTHLGNADKYFLLCRILGSPVFRSPQAWSNRPFLLNVFTTCTYPRTYIRMSLIVMNLT